MTIIEEVREALEHVVGRGLCLTRRSKRRGFSEEVKARAHEKSALPGSKFFRMPVSRRRPHTASL